MKIFGEVLNIDKYQQKHKELFGKHLELAGLEFSDLALKYPIFLWADDIEIKEQIKSIIDEARIKSRRLLIFEDGDSLYKDLSYEKDILLNPFVENGYNWNLFEDYKNNDNILNYITKNIMLECDEYLQAFKTCDLLNNTNEFLDAVCFSPEENTKSILKKIVPNLKEIDSVRKAIAEQFEFLSFLSIHKKEIALTKSNSVIWISCFKKSSMQKLSRFILETSDDNSIKIVLQKESHSIKKTKTIVVNSSFNEFHVRFDGSFLAIGNTKNNKEVSNPSYGLADSILS